MTVGPRTDRSRSLAVRPSHAVAAVSFAVAMWLTLDLILGGPMSRFDDFVSDRIGSWGLRDNAVAYVVGWVITQIGGQRVLILVVVGALVGYLCWTRRTLQPLLRMLVALGLLTIAVYGFKYGLGRTAPAYPGGSFLFRGEQSYPSGHTANAVLMWGLATWLAVYYGLPARVQRLFAGLFVVSPIASAIAMILLDFHWITDVLTGAAVGLILLYLVHLIFDGRLGNWTGFPDAGARTPPTSSVAA